MSEFEDERVEVASPRPWAWALLGYYLIGYAEYMGQYSGRSGHTLGGVLARALLGAIGHGVFHALLLGVLAVWVGSKLFRGPASLGGSVHAVGIALLIPAFAAVPLSILMFVVSQWPDTGWFLIPLGLLLILSLWVWVRIGFAARRLNRFSALRAWGVVLWLPALLLVLAAVAQLVMPSN